MWDAQIEIHTLPRQTRRTRRRGVRRCRWRGGGRPGDRAAASCIAAIDGVGPLVGRLHGAHWRYHGMRCPTSLRKAINNNCTNAWVRRQAAPLGLQMYMREGVSSPRPSTNARLLSWRASRRGSGPPSRPLSCHAAERFQVRRLLTGAFTGAATGRPVLQDLHRAHCAHRANAE